MLYQDSFGFLNQYISFCFENVEIYPKDDFKESAITINSIINKDGFFYPPHINRVEYPINDFSKGKIIPNTERPAELYRLPASHIIKIKTSDRLEFMRSNDAGFIIHFLGYLYGTRLQFSDWFFEGKVPVNTHHSFFASPKIANQVLSKAYKFWLTLDDTLRRIFTNILFMHIKAKCYEWDWEKFTIEYMVFDALFKISKSLNDSFFKYITHKQRLMSMCEFYSISYKATTLEQIVKLRNELFHETLWDGGMPTSGKSHFAFFAADHLHRLNDRIITALIGYKNNFSKSTWESPNQFLFDEMDAQ